MHNWPTKKLGEVCEFTFGYSFKADDFNVSGNGLPVIRIGDIDRKITDKFYDKKYDDRYLVNKGDILIGLSGTIKIDKWRGDKALLNQRIVKVHNFKKDILEDFVFYQLPKILKILEVQIAQGTVKNVLLPHLANLKVLVPPLKIQHQIVERLDAIKKAQELNAQQIALADELFRSLLQRELQPQKSWERKRIKEAVHNITYGISISVVSNLEPGKGVPIITMADITDNGEIDFNKVRKIKLDASDIDKFQLEKGDVLFNWRNASKDFIGKTAIFENDIKAIHASFLLKIKCKPLLNNYYLYYYLHHLRKIGFFREKCKFSANNTINASELKQIYISLPPLETQRQIVEKLQAAQDYKKKLLEQKQKLQELFASCLDRAMKGKLV